MTFSRRNFNKALFAGIPASLAIGRGRADDGGVRIGVCTYSFRELPRSNGDAIGPVIQATKQCDAHLTELFAPQLEPEDVLFSRFMRDSQTPGPDGKLPTINELTVKYRAMMASPEAAEYRQRIRQWRTATPMSYFEGVRKQFQDADIELFAYTLNVQNDYTDEELDKCFQQAKTLRVRVIASSTQVSMLPRLKPLVEKYKIHLAVHGHSETANPDQFSTPETFQKALDMSDWFQVNLDIGHFTAANCDAVAFIKEHHARISHLHFKDRKRNDGANLPFGEGDTPIKPVLLLLRNQRYPIPALVEYEYKGAGTPVEEVKKSLAYMRGALQGA